MQIYRKHSKEWRDIWHNINSNSGYIVGTHKIVKQQDAYKLQENNAQNRYSIVVNVGYTNYCCGVMQLGAFYELPVTTSMIPQETLDEFMKIVASACKHVHNKGILQAWFYKPSHLKEFQHKYIRAMVQRFGFRKIGRETYNPNSGNRIQGYQISLRKAD